MHNDILKFFAEYLEKQDMLSKLTENEKLHTYGYSQIHVIAAIGDLQEANVTAIANALKITKGAVSKITKKLLSMNLIQSYAQPNNRQKVFFKLSASGKFIYDEHAKRHALWQMRDTQFLNQFTSQQLQFIADFMRSYNHYLEEKITEIGEKDYAN